MPKRGIVPFGFGVPSTIRSNQIITQIAMETAIELKAPIFTQADIQFPSGADLQVTYVEEKPGEPPPTLRIAREAVRWAIFERIDELIIVAAGPHMKRCLRDMKEAAKEVGAEWIKIIPHPRIGSYSKEVWFCPDSTQPRSQTEKEWRKRERILDFMPFFIYKRVAS